MIKICNRCNKRYVVDGRTSDYIHQCNSTNPTLDNEDVVVTGNWEDYTGSGNVSPHQVKFQGVQNKLWASDSHIIDNEDTEDVTGRGNRKSTTRARQHLEFINHNLGGN